VKVDRDAFPFAGALVLAAAAAALLHPWAPAAPLLALAFTLWFFRDPERPPPGDPGAVLSPADGRIIVAGERRISVFMSVFDVHVCRTPVAGTVLAVEHAAGRFVAAFRDGASEHNERTAIVVDPQGGPPLRFTLVAGLIARRVVCRVAPGSRLAAGERVGLIRFGSRVDVDLPPGAIPAVRVGDRAVAGRTVIARLADSKPRPFPV
jgi:phosphatidylserine decarboxylase